MSEDTPIKAPKSNPDKGKFKINVTFANDGEPREIFVGADGADFRIRRGEDVIVPRTVLHALDLAIKGVDEVDPNDDTKTIVVQRKRFAYSIIEAL